MIHDRMLEAMNAQIAEELASAYIYQSMAAYCADENFTGAAAWFDVQASEEMIHARKFYDFIIERGGRVVLLGIDAPPKDWDGLLGCFEGAYKHEVHITGKINDLVSLARELKDYASETFLGWFVTEQVEEEASADEIVQKIKMLGDSKTNLYLLDQELGARGAAAGGTA